MPELIKSENDIKCFAIYAISKSNYLKQLFIKKSKCHPSGWRFILRRDEKFIPYLKLYET